MLKKVLIDNDWINKHMNYNNDVQNIDEYYFSQLKKDPLYTKIRDVS